jgi:Tfp pilus assembly protein PilF
MQCENILAKNSITSLLQTEDLKATIKEINDCLQDNGHNPRLHLILARLYLENFQNQFACWKITFHTRKAVSLSKNDPTILCLAGDILSDFGLQQNDHDLWKEGISLLRRAYALRIEISL